MKVLPSTSVTTTPEAWSHATRAWYPAHCASTRAQRVNSSFERGPGSGPATEVTFLSILFLSRGRIGGVPRRLAGQEAVNLQDNQLPDAPARVLGIPSQVGRQDHSAQAKEREIGAGRLDIENVDSRAGDHAVS